MITIDIEYATQLTDYPKAASIKKWIKATLKGRNNDCIIALKVIDEEEMKMLNHTYRHKEGTTNILSFPCQLPSEVRANILGDIAICAPVVKKEALEQNKTLTAHWAHLVIHGTLHLLGYDHEQENEAVTMEKIETIILHNLGFPDPYRVETPHE